MKSAVTYIQILAYYSAFIQTNVSQLQTFRDQNSQLLANWIGKKTFQKVRLT